MFFTGNSEGAGSSLELNFFFKAETSSFKMTDCIFELCAMPGCYMIVSKKNSNCQPFYPTPLPSLAVIPMSSRVP